MCHIWLLMHNQIARCLICACCCVYSSTRSLFDNIQVHPSEE